MKLTACGNRPNASSVIAAIDRLEDILCSFYLLLMLCLICIQLTK